MDNKSLGDFDAAADLDLLSRAKASVHTDLILDFGPWWYAPLLATTVGGLTLFGQAMNTASSLVFGAVALLAGGFMSVHDFRRRPVKSRPSMRGAGFLVAMVIVSWIVVGLWGTAVSSLGYERFMPGYALLGWALTTAFFLVVRSGLYAIRRRRPSLT